MSETSETTHEHSTTSTPDPATPLVCVFCGARDGGRPEYPRAAEALGVALARGGYGVMYGGASIGMMTRVADAALAEGAPAVGVVPHFLADAEIAHEGLTELIRTNTMHERKAIMADRSVAFVALPGGFGTLDELCEILTWGQLHLHHKPILILNTRGYFDHLLTMFDHMVREGFLAPEHRALLVTCDTPDQIITTIDELL